MRIADRFADCCDCNCSTQQIEDAGGCPRREPIPTEPGALEEDRHSAESMGAWIFYGVCGAILVYVIGAEVGFW